MTPEAVQPYTSRIKLPDKLFSFLFTGLSKVGTSQVQREPVSSFMPQFRYAVECRLYIITLLGSRFQR